MLYYFWSGNGLSPVPFLWLCKMNPDTDLPACPGSFHFQSDAKWSEPHNFTSKFDSKAVASVGEPIFPMHRLAWCLLLCLQTVQNIAGKGPRGNEFRVANAARKS
ncbi:hypothetical protein SAMN04515648_0284 [Phyllobacterium sp. CL33Tsu]|nr:hypothetical protein SAMN04515648_0284 [Phyllobacterium sp. CL33Tsu]